jgi:hypothetical protein
MKRIDQKPDCGGQYSNTPVLQHSFTPAGRSRGRSTGDFCGLSLALSARAVNNNETVLPKAVKTAGLIMPRSDLGLAGDALSRRAATISLERRVVSKQ